MNLGAKLHWNDLVFYNQKFISNLIKKPLLNIVGVFILIILTKSDITQLANTAIF